MNGAFKGRGRNYLSLVVCPVDRAALRLEEGGPVRCTADPAHAYPLEGGILRLAAPEQRAALEAHSTAHEAACAAAGWKSPDEDEFKSLPQTGLPGFPDGYWPQQAAATALLWRFLEAIRRQTGALPVGPMGEAAVIGAGMGWLAYALDVAGYTTLAIDSRAGDRFGLGVYPIARYMCVQADPLDPPLAHEAFDWVIFQEGLTSLDNALGALRPGGWVAVIDALSPSGEDHDAAYTLLEEAGLVLVARPRRPGWRGRMMELRDRLAGRDPGVPPVLVAQKPAS